jgi:hypothetical protein
LIPLVAHQGGADETTGLVLLFAGLWVGWIGWSRLRGTGFPRLPAWNGPALIALAVVLGISAVFVPRLFFPGNQLAPGPRPASSATIAFDAPSPGEEVDGNLMPVVVDLRGGRIVAQTSTNLQPDAGHIHLLIDGKVESMTEAEEQVLDVSRLDAGPHTLEAEFVAIDHGPFDPRVTATITFTKGPQ